MNLQWFPGHMAKTRRLMTESLKIIDVAAELLDARLPLSSRNPEIDRILGGKPRVILLNKADMADPAATKQWVAYFRAKGYETVEVSCATGQGVNRLSALARNALAEKIQRDKARGINRSVKIMVCGIPNVGKSSFINCAAGRAAARTGDRPGVTRGKQWLRLPSGVELLDMPGILWPKFDNEEVALRLAYTGAIRDEIIDVEELACSLLGFLRENYPEQLTQRYKLEETAGLEDYQVLEMLAKKRGFLVSKGEFDTFRAANILLDEFRGGKLGRITLELPEAPNR